MGYENMCLIHQKQFHFCLTVSTLTVNSKEKAASIDSRMYSLPFTQHCSQTDQEYKLRRPLKKSETKKNSKGACEESWAPDANISHNSCRITTIFFRDHGDLSMQQWFRPMVAPLRNC
jgi:hypothetical protein